MNRTIKRTDVEADRHPESGIGVLRTERGILPLRSLDVQAHIHGLGSKSVVRQTFYNSYDEPIEATYIFPLPGRDAVTRFVMHVNGRQIDGVLQERGEARENYDRAIAAGHAAAIAEEERSETFTMRVGNIPPGEEVAIEMTLVGQLPIAGDKATFRFPLVVAPRYISGTPLDGKSVGVGTACDTNTVPDASRVTPPVLIPGMPNPVQLSIEVDIHMPESANRDQLISNLSSSLHTVIVDDVGVADGLPLKVRLQENERLNRDFILRFPFLSEQNSCSLLAADDGKGSSVFSVNITPPDSHGAAPMSRDVVFVLDRSGSMGGWKMVAARRAVARMIDTMRDVDRFVVMAFDTSIEFPAGGNNQFQFGTDRNRWDSVQWVSTIDSRGGTELEQAIIQSVSLHKDKGRQDCDPVVVLITDGQVGAEDAVLKAIDATSGSRMPTFFCLGIDKAVNHGLLTRIAKRTSGTCETVESENQLDKVMDRFHREIGAPVLTDVQITSSDIQLDDLTPLKKINVFPDRPIGIHGIAKNVNRPFELTITGKLAGGEPWAATVSSTEADAETLHALWGRERLRDLEDEYLSCSSSELQKQIIAVSLRSNVLSRFTSYVAVDRSRVVNEGEAPHNVVQPVEQVEGSESLSTVMFGSIFGRSLPSQVRAGRSMKMAKAKRRGLKREKKRSGPLGPDANCDGIVSETSGIQARGYFDLGGVASGPQDEIELSDRGFGELSSSDGDVVDPVSQVDHDNLSVQDSPARLPRRPQVSNQSSEVGDSDGVEIVSSLDVPGSLPTDASSPHDDLFHQIDKRASQAGASAVVLQQGQRSQVDLIINGAQQSVDSLSIDGPETIATSIKALAGFGVGQQETPHIGNWIAPSGINWAVLVFYDTDSNPIVLMANCAKNAALTINAINDPVNTSEMLLHYPWLRSVLDVICETANANRQDRSLMLENTEPWLELLREVAGRLSDSQSHVVLRMVRAFKDAFDNGALNGRFETIDVLNQMIDDSNAQIRSEERKAFWS